MKSLPPLNVLRQFGRILKRKLLAGSRMKKVDELIAAGMPAEIRPAMQYLLTHKTDGETHQVVQRAEARRSEIASHGDKEITILYSPKPGSSGEDTSSDLRPEPGEEVKYTMRRAAYNGKNRHWATALFLIARSFRCTKMMELGSCAGIAAVYLASVPGVRRLLTVEGAEAMADIAEESLAPFDNASVVHSMFDDAIDAELPLAEGNLDCAFIDGHHEKIATIHYFNRLKEFMETGAIVVFDDVSWSQDMREAWEELCKRQEFSHAIDLGAIGICIYAPENAGDSSGPKVWDLQSILGRRKIESPGYWKN